MKISGFHRHISPPSFHPNPSTPSTPSFTSYPAPSNNLVRKVCRKFFRDTLTELPLGKPNWHPALVTNGHPALQLLGRWIWQTKTLLCLRNPRGVEAASTSELFEAVKLVGCWIRFTDTFSCCWVEDRMEATITDGLVKTFGFRWCYDDVGCAVAFLRGGVVLNLKMSFQHIM